MERNILLNAPLIISPFDRFHPIFEKYDPEPVVPKVRERKEDNLLKYAGQIDGAVCGDDCFTQRVLEARSP